MTSSTITRAPAPFQRSSTMSTPPVSHVPAIRVTTATPAAEVNQVDHPMSRTILAPKAVAGPRKRLVPKKSKLSLLGGSKKEKSKDFSGVAHRVGAHSPTMGRSFEIYVDPADDPDIGEIVVLRKKKSRVGLNEVQWGPLSDVTNTGKERGLDKIIEMKKHATSDAPLKVKDDEKEKWWTKRGRKDSKGKPKSTTRKKSTEKLTEISKEKRKTSTKENSKQPVKSRISSQLEQSNNSECRQRSQSLDAGVLLGTTTGSATADFITVPMPNDDEKLPHRGHTRTNTSPSLFGERPSTLQGIAAVTQPQATKNDARPRTGSIALRAIRSVRSLARIGSWAQLKSMSADDDDEQPASKVIDKTEKKARKKKERTMSLRSSKNGLEALRNTFGSVRRRVDPSGTLRSVSSTTTAVSTSSDATVRHGRRQSGASVASTIRYDNPRDVVAVPIIGRAPKSSGASTIRWDDRADVVRNLNNSDTDSASSREKHSRTEGKRRSPEGRKRPGIDSLFPDLMQSGSVKEAAAMPEQTAQTGYSEGESEMSTTLLDISCVTSLSSPSRKVRPRPLSEQMLGRERPRGIIGDKDTGVIRMLDSATSDLACLINRLDLEATPTSSPIGESPRHGLIEQSQGDSAAPESAAKKLARQLSMDKLLGSLRTYTHRRKSASTPAAECSEQKVAPWYDPNIELMPSKGKGCPSDSSRGANRVCPSSFPPPPHESAPSFRPLPALSRPASVDNAESGPHLMGLDASFATFGKKRSSGIVNPTKTMRRARRDRGSSASQSGVVLASADDVFAESKTQPLMPKRSTLGSIGTHSICYDPNDPDSDIPRELRLLLERSSYNGTAHSTADHEGAPSKRSSARSSLPSPGVPPREPLPPVQSPKLVFSEPVPSELSDFRDDDAFIASYDDENDTKLSFDFTAELRKLDCNGVSDDKSFVTQLEEAFKTPKKYSMRGLGSQLGLGISQTLSASLNHRSQAHEIALPNTSACSEGADDVQDSSLLSSWSVRDEDMCMKQPFETASRRIFRKPSQGRLDQSFKFGGPSSKYSELPEPTTSVTRLHRIPRKSPDSCSRSDSSTSSAGFEKHDTATGSLVPFSNRAHNQSGCSLNSDTSSKAMTLSDIIPPPEHESRRYSYSSLNENESTMLRSILEKAANLSDVSLSLGSDRVSMEGERQQALRCLVTHSRPNSDVSFSGLPNYSDIRRGFEFGPSRPIFYPPPAPAASNTLLVPNAHWRSSILSLGSVSSYGRVTRDGAKDPFDYAVPSKRISEDMSYTVDDTFSFLRQDPIRQRVDSNASKYSVDSQYSHIRPDALQRRSRRQVESIVSVTSGPPVSLYNRGFNAGRTTLTWRQRTASFDSVASGFSAHRLGRPGVGDKMFESARELGAPLTAISASPSQVDSSMNWHSSYDSLVDEDRDQDSLMDDAGRRSMMASQESLFGRGDSRPGLSAPPQFRPVSVYSFETQGSPKRDDDAVVSMLDGGFVRRRSIRSILERSPCARIEKRHQGQYRGRILTKIPGKDDYDYSVEGSPNKARLISRPSLPSLRGADLQSNINVKASPEKARLTNRQSYASTCSSLASVDHDACGSSEQNPDASRLSTHFGSDRMSLAQHGLLERRSLEECCLSAEGEDHTNIRQPVAVFRRPEPAARRRSASTSQATATSHLATPPLTRSRSSSQFTGSQGSIDLDRLNVLLANSTSIGGIGRERLRRRGSGHRRKISEARASRASSIYETIEEAPEFCEPLSSPADPSKLSLESTVTQRLSIHDFNGVQWDNEDVGPALRMMRSLQHEVRLAVDASRRQWADTAYSIDALQSFQPPMDPTAWKALLEHSKKNFGPLPPEFHGCARRPRTASRPSPYPRVHVFTRPPSVQPPPLPNDITVPDTKITKRTTLPVNPRLEENREPIFRLMTDKPPIPPDLKRKTNELHDGSKDTITQQRFGTRNSVFTTARRLVPRSSKLNVRKSPRKGKENARQDELVRTDTLRISRPRPLNRRSSVIIPRTIRV